MTLAEMTVEELLAALEGKRFDEVTSMEFAVLLRRVVSLNEDLKRERAARRLVDEALAIAVRERDDLARQIEASRGAS